MPNKLSVHDRMPFEVAIDLVETVLSESSMAVLRTLIDTQAQQHGPEVQAYVDHALKLMIHGGYVRRCHLQPGCLAYEKTPEWAGRDAALLPLRAPRYVKRIRPRSREAMECKRLGLPFPLPAGITVVFDGETARVEHQVEPVQAVEPVVEDQAVVQSPVEVAVEQSAEPTPAEVAAEPAAVSVGQSIYDAARGVKLLMNMDLSAAEISKRLARPVGEIEGLALLAAAPHPLAKLVVEEKVSAAKVIDAIREFGNVEALKRLRGASEGADPPADIDDSLIDSLLRPSRTVVQPTHLGIPQGRVRAIAKGKLVPSTSSPPPGSTVRRFDQLSLLD